MTRGQKIGGGPKVQPPRWHPGATCAECQVPLPKSRSVSRYCSRACVLAAVGLPPDFDPTVFDAVPPAKGPGGGYSPERSPDTPAIQSTIRALLDAVVPALRDEVPIVAQGPAARQQMRRRA